MPNESSPFRSSHPDSSIPPFQPRLPLDLIEDLPKRDRYLFEAVDEIKQLQEWLATHAVRHAEKLEAVREQAVKTNGRLLEAETDIKGIKAATDPVVKAYGVVVKAAGSRWFWAGTAAMILFVMPWLVAHAPSPQEFLRMVFGL